MTNLDDLNDYSFCSKRRNSNNIELFVNLKPYKDTNELNMACINMLFNNKETINSFLSLNEDKIKKIANAIPSQIKTLLCLESFRRNVDEVIKRNPSAKKSFDYLTSLNFSEMSKYIKEIELVPALNNESLMQMTFKF